jgi:hypothetical protein
MSYPVSASEMVRIENKAESFSKISCDLLDFFPQ